MRRVSGATRRVRQAGISHRLCPRASQRAYSREEGGTTSAHKTPRLCVEPALAHAPAKGVPATRRQRAPRPEGANASCAGMRLTDGEGGVPECEAGGARNLRTMYTIHW